MGSIAFKALDQSPVNLGAPGLKLTVRPSRRDNQLAARSADRKRSELLAVFSVEESAQTRGTRVKVDSSSTLRVPDHETGLRYGEQDSAILVQQGDSTGTTRIK
jgi:hypothetical protein